jgi:hypothetical protein
MGGPSADKTSPHHPIGRAGSDPRISGEALSTAINIKNPMTNVYHFPVVKYIEHLKQVQDNARWRGIGGENQPQAKEGRFILIGCGSSFNRLQ